MNTQRYLQQIKILDTKIKQKEEQYLEVYNAAISVGAIQYDKEPIQGTKTHDRTERLVCKYLDLEEQITEQKFEFHVLKNKIVDEIQELSDDRFINVLYKRYVEYKSYEEIAKEMHYSFDYIKELHRYSLKAFDSKYPTLSHH